tara:strand:+ start:1744 stop:2622 length:879 start_codon:yes stop_codon:yes gene_type:complete
MKYNNQTDKIKLTKKIYQKILYGLIHRHYYYLSSPFRVLPQCFVIGVVRSGTTSLYHYLSQHPSIAPAAYDELGYFDDNYHLGVNWYKSLFPTKFTKNRIIKKHGKFLTYDVTPFYIYNPLVAKRIFESFPKAKIISNLRNPIDRAYSNYNDAVEMGDIKIPFEEVVQIAMDEIDKNKSKLNNEAYIVDTYYENILARGFYADQLKIWFKKFQKNQLLMVQSEDLAQKTDQILTKIFEFLDLPYFKIKDLTKQNKREYPPMKAETRKLLIEFYRPYNEKLYNLINQHFDWEK